MSGVFNMLEIWVCIDEYKISCAQTFEENG